MFSPPCIDNTYEHYDNIEIKFELNHENLIFKRIPNSYKGEKGIALGLFRADGEPLGESFCKVKVSKTQELFWWLDKLYIDELFRRQGYGGQLLEKTCEALCKGDINIITLGRPGDSKELDGLDRTRWYERHGFELHAEKSILWRMCDTVLSSQSNNNTDYKHG